MLLEHLVANINGRVRRETLDGREFIVAPMNLIQPGVLHGSQGALLYPLDEIQKDFSLWDGTPIVVNHPTAKDGRAVSARQPDILQRYGIGTVFNTTANGKLASEGWFDVEKTRRVDESILRLLKSGKPLELSTGLLTDKEIIKNKEEAVFEGKPYTAIARNYRPDHLAILPDKKGACSVADGCGVNVNEASEEEMAHYKLDWDDVTVSNQLSHSDLRDQLSKLIRDRYGSNTEVTDVFDKSAVYMTYSDGKNKLYEIDYTTDLRTSKVVLSEQGTREVVRETKYKQVTANCGEDCACEKCTKEEEHAHTEETPPVENQRWADLIVNHETSEQKQLQNKEQNMALTEEKKKELIDHLITNEGIEDDGPWVEEDRTALNAMPEQKLVALNHQRELVVNACVCDDEDEEDEVPLKRMKVKPKLKMTKNETPVQNEAPAKPKTTKEWLADAPKEIQSAVTNALAFERRQKEELIGRITKNERNMFSKDYLNARDLEELQALAVLATNADDDSRHSSPQVLSPHYSGVPGILMNLGENFSSEDQDLVPEPFDWSASDE